MKSALKIRKEVWTVAGAMVIALGAVVIIAKPELVSSVKEAEEGPARNEVAIGGPDASGGESSRSAASSASVVGTTSDWETDNSMAMATGPAGYRGLLNRLISSGLMSEYGPEFSRLISGEQLRIDQPCDLETFLSHLRAAETPDEVRAVLTPLVQALREAMKNNDPELADIQRQLGVALLFAAEQVADSDTLTPEQQLDRMVRIGGALGAARLPELALTMNDLAQGFLNVPDSPVNRRNADFVLRSRMDTATTLQDLQLFDGAAQNWMQMSRDQKDGAVAARWRAYAQRLASFPRDKINSQSGATWPGLSDLPASAIVAIGTNWLKASPGTDRRSLSTARDGLVQQLDEIIRARSNQSGKAEEVRSLQGFRNKLATTRIR